MFSIQQNLMVPVFGDFSFIKDELTRDSLDNAMSIVKECEAQWIFNHPIISFAYESVDSSVPSELANKILDRMTKIGSHEMLMSHSAASCGITMRTIQSIYRDGWNNFYNNYINTNKSR